MRLHANLPSSLLKSIMQTFMHDSFSPFFCSRGSLFMIYEKVPGVKDVMLPKLVGRI